MTRKRAEREADAGFAIGVYDQRIIEDTARDRFEDAQYNPDFRKHVLADGVMDESGEITEKGWKILNQDIGHIEKNGMVWMRRKFINARDEGHDDSDLVGTFWYDPTNPDQAYLVNLAAPGAERIDMVDTSYGDFASTAFDGVSDFGVSILGGSITFFDIKPEDMEVVQQTIEQVERSQRQSRGRRAHEARESSLPHLVTGALSPQAKLVHSGQDRGVRFEVYHDPHPPRGAKGHPGNPYSAVVYTPYESARGGPGGVEAEQIGRGHTETEATRIAGGYIARLTAPPRPRGRRN